MCNVNARIVVAVLVGLTAVVAEAWAQGRDWTDRGFVHVGMGFQSTAVDLGGSFPLSVYREQGRVEVSQTIGDRPVYDLAGGVRVWRNLAVGIGFSGGNDVPQVTLTASIPHPLVFDRPRSVSGTADLDHSENAVHLLAVWMFPISDRLSMAVHGGPSFFTVKQGFATDIAFAEVGEPFTSVNLTRVTTRTESESATGINIGADLTYRLLAYQRADLGGGLFLRYAGASVRFTAPGVDEEMTAGGLQVGFGARIRFR